MRHELGYNPTKSTNQLFAQRLTRLTVALLFCLLILVIRLFYLQIIQHDYYTAEEQRNRSNLLAIEPRRGIIYDRNGIILARDTVVYSLSIERDKTPDIKKTLSELQKLLNIDPQKIQIFLKDLKNHPRFAPIPLINRLTSEEVAKFLLNQYQFPGVSIQTSYLRFYPYKEALSAVTGYVSRINAEELKKLDPSDYSASTNIGKTGIEKFFEKELHGHSGFQRLQMDAHGRKTKELENIPPTPGNNLTLTIDSKLQQIAYDALAGERGAVVAIDPNNGQVLALVSSPAYDPNLFVGGIDNDTYNNLRDNADRPLFNRAVRGTFPFGSTIKPFYALYALEHNIITPEFTIFDPGYFLLPGSKHVYHNWTWNLKHRGQGTVNITTALEQSNDTFFFNLAIKMGIKSMAEILRQFGFDQKTGIQLPEESTGHIGTPEWKRLKKAQMWYAGDTLAAGIGQGYMTTTPIQLAEGISLIALKGKSYMPSLLLKQETNDNHFLIFSPRPFPVIQLKPTTWDVVINGLERVISVGTGSYHFGQKELGKPTYSAAGKTGTAQVAGLNGKKYDKNVARNLRDNTLFEAFAPIDHPQIAVAVIVEHNDTAGLVARKVIDYYLKGTASDDKPELASSEES